MQRFLWLCCLLAWPWMCTAAPVSDEAESTRVIVRGEAPAESLTAPSQTEAAERGRTVPGGFTLRSAAELERGRASNFEDLLQRTPGLYLQSDNGAEVTRVSMRGSGILSEDEPLGVQFLLDGLTLNQGDGEVLLEDFDLATIKYAEVFRGANAFRYGAITLGGAINLVTLTGYEIDPFRVRLEGGSYGYFRGQVTGGGTAGRFDYVGSFMGRYREGYRAHSAEDTERLFGTLGYKFNEQLENRIYLTLNRVDRQLPGGLTKNELEDDPEQASADAVAQDFNKSFDFLRLADKIGYRDEANEFEAGVFWFHRNVEERGFFEDDYREGITAFFSDNYGASVNYTRRGELFGRRNIFTLGATAQLEVEVTQNFENLGGQRGETTALNTGRSINAPLYLENQHYLTSRLSLLSGAQFIYAQRDFFDDFLSDDEGDQSHRQNFRGWNPKVGLLYEIDPRSQVFANVSGSWQPPSFDNMVEFAEGENSSVVYTPLRPQRAYTLEIGTRAAHGRFEWEVALYRTWLRRELLELNDAQGNEIGAVNLDRSYHQGIEAGLEIELLDSAFLRRAEDGPRDRLTFGQTYTLNDFHFDDDPVYGDHRIAGIPVHLYEAELLYTTASGFYAGPNLRCNLSRYPVDQANSLHADAYALLGFKVGYRAKKGLSVFLEAKNLTNERYAAAVDPIADARTEDDAQIFHPGDGRSFYGGVSWSW